MIQRISAIVLSFALVLSIAAQKTLPKKPYEQWTLREVTTILGDSPWAQIATNFGVSSDLQASGSYVVEVRLFSALPVRQAIVRRMQLTIAYDKLKNELKSSYDAEVEGLLKCPQCATHYIVTLFSAQRNPLEIVSGRDSSQRDRMRPAPVVDVVAFLKRVPRDDLLWRVSLANDKGDRRTAVRLAFSQRNEIIFLFPRFDDQGKPLITTADKKFYFEVDRELFSKEAKALKKFTFDVSKLVQDGEVVF